MNIEIFTDSKATSFYKAAQEEYSKRISRFAKIKILKLKDFKPHKDSKIFILNHKGTSYTSEEFSKLISHSMTSGFSSLKFIISDGKLSESEILQSLTEKAENISLLYIDPSENLQTTLLLEQIYRGFKILLNESYHK